MKKIQRGLKAAAMLLSLMAAGVAADSGSALAQMGHGQTTYSDGSVVIEHGAGCSSCAAAAEVVYSQPAPVYTASASSCGCNNGGCTSCKGGCKSCKGGCKSCRKKKACPKCDCQFCELDVKKGEIEKTSFYAEQKEVCVPAVRLPWKKCCPPKRSKVRTVNVLKTKKYKCPQCEYKWSVHEPEDFEAAEPTKAAPAYEVGETQGQATSSEPTSIYPDAADALGDVPRPPMEK